MVVGEFPGAVLKTFDYQLTKSHCAPVDYDATIYINKRSKDGNRIRELDLSNIVFSI